MVSTATADYVEGIFGEEKAPKPQVRAPQMDGGDEQNDFMQGLGDTVGTTVQKTVDNPARIAQYLSYFAPGGLGNFIAPGFEGLANDHDIKLDTETVTTQSRGINEWVRLFRGGEVDPKAPVTAEDTKTVLAALYPAIAEGLNPFDRTIERGVVGGTAAVATGGASLLISAPLGIFADAAYCDMVGIKDQEQQILARMKEIGDSGLDVNTELAKLNDQILLGEDLDELPPLQAPRNMVAMNDAGYDQLGTMQAPQRMPAMRRQPQAMPMRNMPATQRC